MFVKSGCGDVETYIQSGNVVFSVSDKTVADLGARIAQQIEARYGIRVPIVLRTAAEVDAVIRGNPFLKKGANEEMLHVCFLADRPTKDLVVGLDAGRSAPDAFAVLGREIYMQLVNGMARTKLTNTYFDSKLKTVSTIRNWRTVLKLAEMLAKVLQVNSLPS